VRLIRLTWSAAPIRNSTNTTPTAPCTRGSSGPVVKGALGGNRDEVSVIPGIGLACNSQGILTAAIDCHVTFQVAVRDGDVLEACAVEASRSKKVCVYRVDVVRAHDRTLVSTFTGTAHITGRQSEPAGSPPPS
jgi:hypothetical protein